MMQYVIRVLLVSAICVRFGSCGWLLDVPDQKIIVRVLRECTGGGTATVSTPVNGVSGTDTAACLADKAARAVERVTNWDLPVFDGITLKKSEDNTIEVVEDGSTGRSFDSFTRLHQAVTTFLDTHTLTLNLAEVQADDEDTTTEVGEARGYSYRDSSSSMKPEGKRGGKRKRRIAYYVMMVLLGIYGISGPLIMKGLAVIAGKALIASKIALMLAGSIALKKIFSHGHGHSGSVKVHSHTISDDHDRYYNVNSNGNSNVASSNTNSSPYSAYATSYY